MERERPRGVTRQLCATVGCVPLGWGLSFGESWNQEIIIRSDRGCSGSARFPNFHTPVPMSFFQHGVDLLVTANADRDGSGSFPSSSSFSSVVHNSFFPSLVCLYTSGLNQKLFRKNVTSNIYRSLYLSCHGSHS